ncbi:hypothetical protein [Burkholderia cenocepacia]|uniref:hypothetical protein n=1 Tax=Burkholderia cenocepacia TaxID=95486 RepID=UPI0013E01F2D|nr:hypothetical protein [Burkholderia cenocepacia]MCW3587365.1 hypothetical protein [Burkholderia cenocepacia]MCW3632569.1 hypothetical protein [Burkholderia cenocepacia]MCW5181800.1 hypothetical protein [Burkholderia cenocepacia]NGO98067.1 hypothetical protein [Burkholderia cenocepacia]
MTALQKAFVEMCIADAKYEIVSLMSINLISYSVRSYNDLCADIDIDRYGFCTEFQIAVGQDLFPDVPGEPKGSGFDAVYSDVICTALDEWLSGPIMPMDQISFPPDPAFEDTEVLGPPAPARIDRPDGPTSDT